MAKRLYISPLFSGLPVEPDPEEPYTNTEDTIVIKPKSNTPMPTFDGILENQVNELDLSSSEAWSLDGDKDGHISVAEFDAKLGSE